MKPKPLSSLNHFTVLFWHLLLRSPLFEIARVLVRLDHVASVIVNANHSIMCAAVMAGVADCVASSVRFVIPQATEWQRIGNQIGSRIFRDRTS